MPKIEGGDLPESAREAMREAAREIKQERFACLNPKFAVDDALERALPDLGREFVEDVRDELDGRPVEYVSTKTTANGRLRMLKVSGEKELWCYPTGRWRLKKKTERVSSDDPAGGAGPSPGSRIIIPGYPADPEWGADGADSPNGSPNGFGDRGEDETDGVDNPHPSRGLLTLPELLKLNITPPPVIIENFLFEGQAVVLAGRPKLGKSLLTELMALSLVTQQPFLGMRIPVRRRVLIVNLENAQGSDLGFLKERFEKLMATMGVSDGDANSQLVLYCAESLDAKIPDCSPAGAKRLEQLVDEANPDVMVIDNWRLFLAGGNENETGDILKALRVLSAIRRRHPRLAILIVHHTKKEIENPRRLLEDPNLWADAISGHSAFISHLNGFYGIESDDGSTGSTGEVFIFGGCARNTRPRTLMLEKDEDSQRFSLVSDEDSVLKVMTPAEGEIWKKIRGLKRFSFTEAVIAAVTKNRKAVISAIRKAMNHGLLVKEDESYIRVG